MEVCENYMNFLDKWQKIQYIKEVATNYIYLQFVAINFFIVKAKEEGQMEENKEVLLTQEEFDKLEQELENLKTVKRVEIAERIKVALGFGDLSENSEYDEAKNAQAENETKIAELENKIRYAKIN